MSQVPSLRRALGLYGSSFALMMLISLVFYAVKGPKAGINIPWLSVAISLFAVLAPSLIVCFWPSEGAPGAFPSFKAVSPWLLAGAGCFSLPFYMVFAFIQIGLSKVLPGIHVDTGLVQPLTAGSPGAFLWIWLAIALLPALTEETMYRGVMQRATIARFGPVWGLLAASLLFSIAHMEPAGSLSRVLMGLWFGYLFWRTGSLWPGALAHALNNSWGVALANWHGAIEAHLPWVYAGGVLALVAGYACFHQAGFWPWQHRAGGAGEAVPSVSNGPELPRFVQVRRPEPPKAD